MAKTKIVREPKLTYFTKKPLVCPVCGSSVPKEELLSGSGRLIAGALTDELHRLYEPTQKFGKIYPLAYSVVVCSNCFFAAFPADYEAALKDETVAILKERAGQRQQSVAALFDSFSFLEPRTLNEGTASYLLALLTYEHMPKNFSPAFKQGLCCLRGAWLAKDLDEAKPGQNYGYLSLTLYRKASFFYRKAVEMEEQGQEAFSTAGYLGPDQDNNYGFDGVQYLAGLLEFKYGSHRNRRQREAVLEASRRAVSKIVGLGKANKNKPTAILDMARDLYERIKMEQEAFSPDSNNDPA